jgi:aspartyl-tRNA(Asn)/glutamyl-tRNA(Gln) amidotransferase subunit C
MDIEDLKVTAALAHLNLDEGELQSAFPAFEQMLGFFAAMQAADEDTAAFPLELPSRLVPTEASAADFRHVDAAGANVRTVISSHFRPDAQAACGGAVQSFSMRSPTEGRHTHPNNSHTTASNGLNDPPEIRNLIDNAGERDDRFIVVPNVL